MKEEMQKMTNNANCPQKNRTESEGYEGVQTFIGIEGEKLVEVHTESTGLLEYILHPETWQEPIKRLYGIRE